MRERCTSRYATLKGRHIHMSLLILPLYCSARCSPISCYSSASMRVRDVFHRPSRPENQFASCCPLMLGVKLSTLSAPSLLCSGVYGAAGTVLPLGLLVGVDLRLDSSLNLGLELRDAD
jgi:hypothetical protein